jgi:hypothetical protein
VVVCERCFSEDQNIIISKYAVDMRRATAFLCMKETYHHTSIIFDKRFILDISEIFTSHNVICKKCPLPQGVYPIAGNKYYYYYYLPYLNYVSVFTLNPTKNSEIGLFKKSKELKIFMTCRKLNKAFQLNF